MALNYDEKKDTAIRGSPTGSTSSPEKATTYNATNAGADKFTDPFDPARDLENDPASKTRSGFRHPMNRIDRPRTASIVGFDPEASDEAEFSIEKQKELEADSAIKYRTCSWQKTAALLFSEYICLAIMSFPWSYSLLGLVPGIILTIVIASIVLYTSLTVWEFCMRHPEVKDVCDIGQMLFWNYRAAWWVTGVMFLLNNTFIMGFHCLVGAEYLNTVSSGGLCTIGFSIIFACIQWAFSLPRTFDMLAKLATASAIFTFISVILATAFAGIEGTPRDYDRNGGTAATGPLRILAGTPSTTTYVTGMSAFLNISYTFIGQITLPSFIAEMKEPKDFPKAVWAVTIAEIIVFSIVGAVTYNYMGQYTKAPAFNSLSNPTFRIVSFSFMIPTMIFLGVLYASVSARFIFFNIFGGTKHMSQHTVKGWASWAGILAVLWLFAFIIAECIPFFSDLLSLMSSLFDSFFGFIFWGLAYLRMRRADYGSEYFKARGLRGMGGTALNITLILIGFYFLTAGTYVSVQSIIDGYASGSFPGAFSCASNGFESKPGSP